MRPPTSALRWGGVELRHLATLRTVATVGSLAGAARELGYSQPAVSQQLAALERLVGARLVERRAGAHAVALTEAGALVLLHGNAMLSRAHVADAELRALSGGTAGSLRLGTIPSIGARLVPPLVRRLRERWPDVEVQLVEDDDDRPLLAGVEAAQLDATFAILPTSPGPFAVVELLADPYVVVVAADSDLARRGRRLGVRDLASLELITCSQSRAPEDYLRAHGIAAQMRHRISDNETLVGLVAAGMGAALVPRLVVDPGREDVVVLELASGPPARPIGLAWHSDRRTREPVSDLVALAHEACRECGYEPIAA
jgi:molybdate transport repressor ModE-like protein